MSFSEADKKAMDDAAIEAASDLSVSDEALAEVANWWNKWYLKAGHKRLARVLLQHAKKS